MEPQIYEVKSIGQGILYIMPCPKADQLGDGLARLSQMGIHKVVSLLEKEEAVHLGAAMEGQLCKQLGMAFEQFPIRDRNIPKKPPEFRRLANRLYDELNSGSHIAIHCYAGIGRTGLLAGALLLAEGMTLNHAVELMSDVRGHNMPQTQHQYEYLLDYASGEEALEAEPIVSSNWLRRLFSSA